MRLYQIVARIQEDTGESAFVYDEPTDIIFLYEHNANDWIKEHSQKRIYQSFSCISSEQMELDEYYIRMVRTQEQ